MSMSPEGKKNLGCDGKCYGCYHDFNRKEPCPLFEKCEYNPLIKQEAFAGIFCWIAFLGTILWISSIIISFIKP